MRSKTLMKAVTLTVASIGLTLTAPTLTRGDDAKPAAKMTLKAAEPTAQELATAMGAFVWKFDVANPPDAERISVSLHLREAGKDLPIGSGVVGLKDWDGPSGRTVFVAIVPLGADGEKARITLSGFGTFASSVVDNPFKNLPTGTGRPAVPEVIDDHTFALMGFFDGGTVSSPVHKTAKTVLTLTIKPE